MDQLSQIVLVVMAGMLVITTFFVAFRILRNLAFGRRFRSDLAERMSKLRIHKMLEHLGRDRTEYLHNLPIVKIENQLRACENCAATDTCDDVLDNGHPVPDFDFCPNHPDLLQVVDSTPKTPTAHK